MKRGIAKDLIQGQKNMDQMRHDIRMLLGALSGLLLKLPHHASWGERIGIRQMIEIAPSDESTNSGWHVYLWRNDGLLSVDFTFVRPTTSITSFANLKYDEVVSVFLGLDDLVSGLMKRFPELEQKLGHFLDASTLYRSE